MIYIASDHGGFKLKKRLIRFFQNDLKIEIEDIGPFEYDKTDDYPDFAEPLAKKVAVDTDNKGIAICRNGAGMCITANKIKGIRAALGFNIKATEKMAGDDNINVLCLAGDYLTDDHAMAIIKKWLEIPFSNESRHKRRLRKIEKIEKNN